MILYIILYIVNTIVILHVIICKVISLISVHIKNIIKFNLQNFLKLKRFNIHSCIINRYINLYKEFFPYTLMDKFNYTYIRAYA